MLKIGKILKLHKKIRVYFIVQYKAGCDKLKDVIETMKIDEDIELKVIAFPEEINEFSENKDLSFWKKQLGNIVINSIQKNSWFNLKKEKPDYVFIQRPYDIYLPKEYSKKELASYTKLCYIPYGYCLGKIYDIIFSKEDMKLIYIVFAENEELNKYYNSLIETLDDNKKRHSMYFGYPILDRIKKEVEDNNSTFKKIKNKKYLNVLWTLRWTTDKRGFETSFFTYKDTLLDYCKNNENIYLVFRPHP